MLERIAVAQIQRIAEPARAARAARDEMLTPVREAALGEPKVARGWHDPAAGFGLDPLPPDHPARTALDDAIATLPRGAQDEIRALVLAGEATSAPGTGSARSRRPQVPPMRRSTS